MELSSFPLIGMIHLPDLTSFSDEKLDNLIDYAKIEAIKLDDLGYSGIMVENFNDSPFVKSRVSDTVFIKMGIILHAIKNTVNIPVGLNILRNATEQALSIASVLDLQFIRANIGEGAYVTDQGIIEGAAQSTYELKNILNSKVKIFADIHVKHAYPIGNFSILESAENALLRGKADKIIISGISTGREPELSKIKELSNHGFKPIIGSGLNAQNLSHYKDYISGAIVGSSIKIGKQVLNPIDVNLAQDLIELWKK